MPKILVIGHVWPEPDSSAAGSRMMQLLDFFLAEDYEVHFATTAARSQNMANLETLGIVIKNIKLNNASFDEYLKSLAPEIVLFDRFMTEEQFGWRVDEFSPQALKILDTEDLHFLRKARSQALKNHQNAKGEIFYQDDITIREISAIYRCDLSLIISEAEMELLSREFRIPDDLLCYLPYMLDQIAKPEQQQLPEFEDRENFMFIGNFLHEPNWDAVRYLKETIWPGIKKCLPAAQLHIYGAYATEKVLQLHNPQQGFLVKGHAKDKAKTFKNARLCLAPLRFGAGLKGKFVEAMTYGTPSVSTGIGAEGINGNLPWGGFIADDPEIIIEKAVQLYSDKSTWQQAQQNGFNIINNRFNGKQFREILRFRISEIESNLLAHRNRNFTGKMLKHHLHRSTYFMSRFIEEKNKK